MFSGVIFAFWIMPDYPILSILIIIGAVAFFRGIAGIGRQLKDLSYKTNDTFLKQRKIVNKKSNVEKLIDEVNKNGMVEQGKNRTKTRASEKGN
jgi:hypothetical protein